ncbi:MAG: L,D-transpeptidase family protein [Luteolibacter sp.]
MKSHLLMGLLSAGSLASCQEKEMPAAEDMSEKKFLPGEARAAKAAANVRPALERDLAAAGLHFGDPVFIRAFKYEAVLEFFIRNRATEKFDLFRTYKIAGLSGNPGPKLAEGDGQVPEGFYYVPPRAMNPNSQYHLSFNIGYPNEYDRAHQRTGSAIMIHGDRISIGCLAMTDEKIEEIYTLCAAAHAGGQAYFRVHIFPFRMTAERLEARAEPVWNDFWLNLKEGHDLFEKNRVPPEVSVADGRYQFK